jgi:primosomal protein N' (replication factor Y)
MRCKNCDITLTLHRAAGVYKCHYCGFSRDAAAACPACGAARLRLLGLGTEKIEAAVKALFPDARVARMDRDTTGRKGAVLKLLKGLNDRTTDILIGTQIVAKGHDFPHITLVGIVCADLSLGFPDFRAGERTFQLLAQVSGRAGRGGLPGKVILQTYTPAHFCILSAREHDFREFYRREIFFRRELNYPPFSRMAQVRITGREKEKTASFAAELGSRCARVHPKKGDEVEVLGPLEAPIPRIAGEYRWQLLMKAKSAAALNRFLRSLLFENGHTWGKPGIGIAVDVDPLFML